MARRTPPPLEQVLGSAATIDTSRIEGDGPDGRLPLTAEMLRNEPSGNIFGLTQNAGMGWRPEALGGPQYVIVSTMGGVRSEQGEPIALGYHTGHWEIGLLVRGAAEALRAAGAIPFAVYCSDPCDGRTQGTTGMFDSLAYRNDAAIVMRRLIRSLPTASGVLGIATCDKGLPATMLALAGTKELPGVIVPGGVTLPARDAEDAGQVQSLGARFTHDLISLDYAATMGCRACGSSGGGCQFLGTAATSQVVAEASGAGAAAQCARAVGRTGLARAREPLRHRAAASPPAWRVARSDPHRPRHRERDARPCRVRRLHESAAARAGDRRRRRAEAAGRRGLDPDQSRDTAPRRRAAERTTRFRDRPGVHGRRRSRGDAASPPHGAAERACAHGDRRHARRHARLVGIERAAPGGTCTARIRGANRSGRGHHGARRGTPRGADLHGGVSARQPRAAGLGHQGHRDRCLR